MAHPRLSVRGKNEGLLIQQSGPRSARTAHRLGGRAQAVPPPSLPWWLRAHLPGGCPPDAAAAVRQGMRACASKAHVGRVSCCLPTACNFGKMGAGHLPSRNGVPCSSSLGTVEASFIILRGYGCKQKMLSFHFGGGSGCVFSGCFLNYSGC